MLFVVDPRGVDGGAGMISKSRGQAGLMCLEFGLLEHGPSIYFAYDWLKYLLI